MNAYDAMAAALTARAASIPALTAVVGFDGFVDELLGVVGERRGPDDATMMPDIAAFAAWAGASAGRSSLREVVVRRQDPGGCAVNLGDGLAALGARVELFATLGDPPHPAFATVTRRFAAVHPLAGVHGRTLALEFPDGKLMLSAVAQLAALDPDYAAEALCAGAYPAACARARLIALTNWSLYPHMTAVWALLAERVFARLDHRPALLVDLVDPGGRSPADVRAMLAVLPRLAAAGRLSLGLNLNEANTLARLLGLPEGGDDAGLSALAARLRTAIGIDEVVVHAVRRAACAAADHEAQVDGPYCEHPVKLTGAGDRFNAGYGLGLMLDLPADQRLALGCAASGWFVRHGASAGVTDLAGR